MKKFNIRFKSLRSDIAKLVKSMRKSSIGVISYRSKKVKSRLKLNRDIVNF